MKAFALWFVPLLLLGACGRPTSGGALDGGGGCGASSVTANFQGTDISYSCFSGSNGSVASVAQPGALLWISPQREKSSLGLNSGGINLFFSADPSCHFAAGVTVQLSDPCLFIQEPGDSTLPASALNYQSGCSFKGGVQQSCNGMAADKTAGSVTFSEWSDQSGGSFAFAFSSDAAVTGFYYASPSAGTLATVAVPLAGSASGSVD